MKTKKKIKIILNKNFEKLTIDGDSPVNKIIN